MPTQTIFYTQFSFETILLKTDSKSGRSCAATPGVSSASLRTEGVLVNFGVWSTCGGGDVNHLGSRCTFLSLQRSYWQHWASISGTISFTPVQGLSMASWKTEMIIEATSDITPSSFLGNIFQKGLVCLCISDHQGYYDRIYSYIFYCRCSGIFRWNFEWHSILSLEPRKRMADVLTEGTNGFALLWGIVLCRCVWARCPAWKFPI